MILIAINDNWEVKYVIYAFMGQFHQHFTHPFYADILTPKKFKPKDSTYNHVILVANHEVFKMTKKASVKHPKKCFYNFTGDYLPYFFGK
jgi:hypothetical protein